MFWKVFVECVFERVCVGESSVRIEVCCKAFFFWERVRRRVGCAHSVCLCDAHMRVDRNLCIFCGVGATFGDSG